MNKVKIIASALLFLLALCLIVFFPEIMMNANGKVPMGTYVAWFAIVFYSMFWYYLLPVSLNIRFLRNLKRWKDLYFLLAVSWGFVSAWLAGNWQFAFRNTPSRFNIWIAFTVFILVLPILVQLFIAFQKINQKKK